MIVLRPGRDPLGHRLVARVPSASAQRIFEQTGGLHAAALFDREGRLIESHEDVGRHNAVDKLIGHAFSSGRDTLRECVLLVSGRVSFEIVQKAAVAGIPVTCAVSAPSSLAVQAGERLGMTVVGFLRGEKFNIYCHPRTGGPDELSRRDGHDDERPCPELVWRLSRSSLTQQLGGRHHEWVEAAVSRCREKLVYHERAARTS